MAGRASRVQQGIAGVVLALPFLFVLTDYSLHPWIGRWARRDLAWLAFWGALWVGFIGSYRWQIPRGLEVLRASLVAVAATLVLNAVLAEGLLQLLDDAPYEARPMDDRRHAPDPDVGHVFVPNHSQTTQTREWRATWRTNGEGVRAERDYGPRPPGVARVLVLGDSFTAGGQVEWVQTYPGVIQRELDRALGEGRVEVVNAGHPAYGTVHEMRWLRKFGARFEPTVVLLGMTPNDLAENLHPLLVTAEEGRLKWKVSTERHKARFQDRRRWYSIPGWIGNSLLRQRLGGLPVVRKLTTGHVYTHRHAWMVEPDAESKRRYALATQALGELIGHAREMGARVAIIVIPFREQLTDLRPGLDPFLYGQRIAAFGAPRGVPVRDALPAFRAHPDPSSLYWREDTHCTAAGYEVIGIEATKLLLENARTLGLPTAVEEIAHPPTE